MTNHVHLIVKPKKKSNLSEAIGEVHRRYTWMINLRENRKGYLWRVTGKLTCKKHKLIPELNLSNMGERADLWGTKILSKKQGVFYSEI